MKTADATARTTLPGQSRFSDGGDPNCLSSREQVAAVAARLGHGLFELATDVRDVIEATVPALRDDQSIPSLLETSVEQNIETMLGMLAHGIDPAGVGAPSAALEHARRLAQRGVSTFALIRAYRVGQARFLRRLIEDLVHHGAHGGDCADTSAGNATLEMVQRISDYIDRVVEELIVAYAQAREEWLKPNAILNARVRSVLNDKAIDLETAQARLGTYRIRQYHLALELWLRGPAADGRSLPLLRAAADALASVAGCIEGALFVPIDESSACVWLPLDTRSRVDRNILTATLTATPEIFAALGEPSSSLAGFRRTHQQAFSAAVVARVNDPPRERVTPYIDVAPIAAMCSDLESARAWVSETLGPLAINGERQARFRKTARVFFATGGSYAATADLLHLHRNTAQYRVRKAEEMRGRPFRDERLDVELALLAAHWLGRAVLQPAARSGPGGKKFNDTNSSPPPW